MAAADVIIPLDAQGVYLAAYRRWMGLAPYPSGKRDKTVRQPAAALSEPADPVEFVVLSVQKKAARCRLLVDSRAVTFRADRLCNVVPGEIAVVRATKQWIYAGAPHIGGAIESTRLDVNVLGLVPLRLEEQGLWNPAEHYWGEEREPIEEWAKPIIARGPRPEFEMEQVLPGADIDDPLSDPITESNDRRNAGDSAGAYKLLMDLCQADLRCLDAHSHLGNLAFDRRPNIAIRHYEAGFCIGELSLGESFNALLPWGWIDNRPFLRCMQGFALCLWRLNRFAEAARIFDRMLWLNPSDNQGVRFLVDQVRQKAKWRAGL